MTRTSRLTGATVLGALALGTAVAGYLTFRNAPAPAPAPPADVDEEVAPDPPPPDPRLTFATPFRNVKPGVRYVGDAGCAACHPTVCTSYHAHPMGRSAALVAHGPVIEDYAAGATPRAVGPFELRVVKAAGGVTHRVSAKDAAGAALPDYAVSADVAIGSGTRGRSYLTVDGGTVWQSPVSWFTAEARWDVSPGFDLSAGGRRAIVPGCLFCHVDRVEPVPLAANRYREPLFPGQAAIGCERCHGPGELHVAERAAAPAADKVDTSIVNPKHLPPDLQSAVCAQCHLQGQERVTRRGRDPFEFRPGLPFDLFVTTFVRHPDLADAHRSVGQFEQLEVSRCAPPGGGRLLCTSCHDPHAVPAAADRAAHYRARCNACHGAKDSKGCSAPPGERAASGDSCVACHMPKAASSNIAHASVTDHRVMRRPAAPPPPRGLPPAAEPLVPFRAESAPAAERERDLGIALARASGGGPPGVRAIVARQARERLTASLARWGGDADAWAALAAVRSADGDADGRLKAAERAARLAPGSETALSEVAAAALAAERFDRAEEAASALVTASPTSVEHRVTRATGRIMQKRWAEAEADCRAALRIHPLHPQARLMLAACLHRLGDPTAGRKEADAAAGLTTHPRQRAAFQDWFERETR